MAISQRLWRNAGFRWGALVLILMVAMAVLAPWLDTVDPGTMDASNVNVRFGTTASVLQSDGNEVQRTFWMGTDGLGRDVFSRVLYGARVSLTVGLTAAAVAVSLGGLLGLMAGYFRAVDAVLMRVMDGLMAIPTILLAITLVAALGPTLGTVVFAIALPEIPRVTRMVRSLALSLREEPYVEAARSLATPSGVILVRHILPNAVAPLIVQGTFICASAILTEAVLSFLGLGLPPEIPTWGNIMAEARVQFTQYPMTVFFPALFLVPTVLAINALGDSLRDVLDPKFRRSMR